MFRDEELNCRLLLLLFFFFVLDNSSDGCNSNIWLLLIKHLTRYWTDDDTDTALISISSAAAKATAEEWKEKMNEAIKNIGMRRRRGSNRRCQVTARDQLFRFASFIFVFLILFLLSLCFASSFAKSASTACMNCNVYQEKEQQQHLGCGPMVMQLRMAEP